MNRKFSNLNEEASLKNISDKDTAVVPYGSRTGATKLSSQEELSFEISSASKAMYYFKQQNESLESKDLYEEDGPTPPHPTTDKLVIENNSDQDFSIKDLEKDDPLYSVDGHSEMTIDIISSLKYKDIGMYLKNDASSYDYSFTGVYGGIQYSDSKLSLVGYDHDAYTKSPSGDLVWTFSDGDYGVLSIIPKQEQYIYEKGEDSDVDFNVYHRTGGQDVLLNEGDALEDDWFIHVVPADTSESTEAWVGNDRLYSEEDGTYFFTFRTEFSTDNKVVITVKRH